MPEISDGNHAVPTFHFKTHAHFQGWGCMGFEIHLPSNFISV